ncbi:MAG TPA: ATP-binding protein, partial [Polyangiaceae bacterium]|nr:ATP-binding protein [Polyangiaceae bacterium]
WYAWLSAFACAVVAAFGALAPLLGLPRASYLIVALALMAVGLARGLAFRVRAALLLAVMYVGASLPLFVSGTATPNGVVALCAVAVLATALLGRNWGVMAAGLGGATLLVTALLLRRGVIARPPLWSTVFDIGTPAVAFRVATVFLALCLLLVISLSSLLRRSELLLLEKVAALEQANRERDEKERAQRELALRDEALHRARELETLGRLAGCAAHDLNNALTVVTGHASLARAFPGDARVAEEALAAIDAATASAVSTTRQLRAFSQQARRSPQALSLGEQVERAADMLQRLFPAGISVRTELHAAPEIWADEGTVQRVVTNLAMNARDAMHEGGTLQLRVRPALEEELPAELRGGRGFVALEVEDSGSGMDADTLAKVFEPFFTTKGAAGTGLGLSSVRDMVTELGGRVAVESRLEAGTCFRVLWPRAEAAAERVRSLASEPALSGARVLIVDDDPLVRGLLVRVFSMSGCAVLDAAGVGAALLLLSQSTQPTDLLVTDCAMPGPPARNLVEEYRARNADGRVLMCSGFAPEEAAPLLRIIDGYLQKPFSSESLLKAASTALGKGRAPGNAGF